VAAAGLALALVVAPAAEAHSVLVDSTPAPGATLDTLPDAFSVTFDETLLADAGDAAFAMRIVSADRRYYGDGCLTIVDNTMSTDAAVGPAGDYTVEWQVVSADGHPVGGEIPFTWTGDATAEGSAQPAACGATATLSATQPPELDAGHHDTDTSVDIPLGDVLWIVGAVLVVAIAVTVALIATRRR
ncbi:copper resistance protein CopC, partial [Schumannella luteola]